MATCPPAASSRRWVGRPRNSIARLNADGSLDATWNPDAYDVVYALAVSGGDVYAGGYFWFIGGQERVGIAKLSTGGVGRG